jgi:radical SAM superfamily enzyme YgiQ (UPF0313 family)
MPDVAFIHPPMTVGSSSSYAEFSIMPMGLIPMAALIEDEGYSAKIFNLGLERALNPSLDVERFIRSLDAEIFAIDLQWFVHSNGAVNLANLCKKHHPNSLIVLGGFMATFYDDEILRNYPSINVIVRGEGEYTMRELTKSSLSKKKFDGVRGITFRDGDSIKRNEFGRLPDIDKLDFTRLSLIERWEGYLKCAPHGYAPDIEATFWLNTGRGCPFNCIYCGGASKCYQMITGRSKPIKKDPEKIVSEISELTDFGVRVIRLSHDPELFGEKFSIRLLDLIKKEDIDVFAYWEPFRLPSKPFIEKAAKTFGLCNVGISPESASDSVRMNAGRMFTNDQLMKTIDLLEEHDILTDIFFLIGLPGETKESIEAMKKMTIEISKRRYALVDPVFPYTMDPHCPMALEPEKYGVKLIFKTFEDYRKMCINRQDWLYNIGHETSTLTRREISDLTKEMAKFTARSSREMGVTARWAFDC